MSADPRNDRDLETAFAALREEDRRRAPSYEALRGDAPSPVDRLDRRPHPLWAVVAAAGLGAIALAALLVGGGRGVEDDLAAEIAMAGEIAAWSAPTDALYGLATLGIPDSVPGLDVGSGYVPDALATGAWQDESAAPSAADEEDPR